ncbi:MAG: hypothetical protein OXM87_03380 [Truepera sp.]|nr:hypothetical protein [Truepera sp.]
MALNYLNLDDKTRSYMIEEIDRDIANDSLYIGRHLNQRGIADWPDLLRTAAQSHDDDWLTGQLRHKGYLLKTTPRQSRSGGYTMVEVRRNAPEMLAEGEFNRFYARGLCRRAIDEGIDHVIAYRAKTVTKPHKASEAKIGNQYDPEVILTDLRTSQGVGPALGIPRGPNSGISLRLP